MDRSAATDWLSGDEDSDGLQACAPRYWVKVIERIDFSTAAVVQGMNPRKRPANRTIKLVAFRLAWWADFKTGEHVRPGVGAIAASCDIDYDTVKAVLRVLGALGLIDVIQRGGNGRTSHLGLTVPTDLLARVTVRDPDDLKDVAEDLTARHRKPSNSTRKQCRDEPTPEAEEQSPHRQTQGGCTPVELHESRGGRTPQSDPAVAEVTEGMHPPADASQGGCTPGHGGGPPPLIYQSPTTQLHQPQTSPEVSTSPASPTADPDDSDLSVRVAALRAAARRGRPRAEQTA